MAYKRGIKQERDLVNWLYDKGFQALRCAGSGAGTKRPLPDIMAGNQYFSYGIELKSSNQDYIRIADSQIEGLKYFCAGFGAVPIVCANFTRLPYAFFNINEIPLTRNGHYKITRDFVENRVFVGRNVTLK